MDRAAPVPLARYLIAIDFSPASMGALQRAIRLAAASGGELHLLHVEAPGAPAAIRKKARLALAKAMAVTLEVGRRSGDRGVRATSSMRTGEPYVEIIRCAREIGADIVVIGRGGSKAARRRLVGSTAARVVRMSDVPTLVAGRRSRAAYRRPLIAVEIDPSARSLIELTRRLVQSNAVPLRVIHAYRVPFESYYLANPDRNTAAYFREARKSAAVSMTTLLEAIGSREYALETVLRRGDARTAIAKEAARCRADLIALGTHGRSGVSHVLLGSVAEWIVANTSRDVLIARPVRFTFVPP